MPDYFKWRGPVPGLVPARALTAPPRTGHGPLGSVWGAEVIPKWSIALRWEDERPDESALCRGV